MQLHFLKRIYNSLVEFQSITFVLCFFQITSTKMAFRLIVVFAAAALLTQTVYSQQCGCSSNYGSQIVSPVSLSSLGYSVNVGSGCGGNLGYSGVSLGNSGVNYGSSNLGTAYPQGVEALTISTGSSYAPSAIIVSAENLEIGGQLLVTGQLPIIGTVSVSGDVPTGGQVQVQYNTAPGIGLTAGGCGYGLASNVPNVQYGNAGLVGSGLGLLGGGNGQGSCYSCGCGLY